MLGPDGCVFGRVFDKDGDLHARILFVTPLSPAEECRASRVSAISAKPAPHSFVAMKAGRSRINSLYRLTLATPHAMGKWANIGSSLGESPAKSTFSLSVASSAEQRRVLEEETLLAGVE